MPQAQTVKSGTDVTAIMGAAPTAAPKSGDDVTALMGQPAARQPSTNTGLLMTAAAAAVPVAAKVASEIATNPNLPKLAASAGRVIGGVAPIVAGAVQGGPIGALIGVAASAKGAWAGGGVGWHTAKLAQKITAPMAEVLVKAAPYMQALTTLGGVQSGLDLAQLAEPDRKDIGFFGVGKSQPDPDHPALLNLAAAKVTAAINALMGHGLTKDEAAQALVESQKRGK